MRPAFTSTKQAAAFGLLVLMILLSPVLVGKNLLAPREQDYSNQGWASGPYPWIESQIFQETNDVDIVFVGSSHILQAIDTPYVQSQLSQRLGHQTIVRTLGWGGAGYDILYYITADLLSHRKVRMLVFYDECPLGIYSKNHNDQLPFRFGENAWLLTGLPWRDRGFFYLSAIKGIPRNVLNLCRGNVPASLVHDKTPQEINASAPNPATCLGAWFDGRGFGLPGQPYAPFIDFKPVTATGPADVMVYSEESSMHWQFSTSPLPAWQAHFARQFGQLLRDHDVQPVMLYIPILPEANLPLIPERTFWPRIFGTNLMMMGVPAANFFGALKQDDIKKLFVNPDHFNRNGLEYFTRIITPRLLEIYENSTNN